MLNIILFCLAFLGAGLLLYLLICVFFTFFIENKEETETMRQILAGGWPNHHTGQDGRGYTSIPCLMRKMRAMIKDGRLR